MTKIQKFTLVGSFTILSAFAVAGSSRADSVQGSWVGLASYTYGTYGTTMAPYTVNNVAATMSVNWDSDTQTVSEAIAIDSYGLFSVSGTVPGPNYGTLIFFEPDTDGTITTVASIDDESGVPTSLGFGDFFVPETNIVAGAFAPGGGLPSGDMTLEQNLVYDTPGGVPVSGDYIDISFVVPASVPEPSTVVLVATGVLFATGSLLVRRFSCARLTPRRPGREW